jgi:succinate-acetate transporter protein
MFILTIFAVFIISHYKFIKFLLKENGYVFAVISMGVAIFQNIIYDIGGFMGIISGLFEKSK